MTTFYVDREMVPMLDRAPIIVTTLYAIERVGDRAYCEFVSIAPDATPEQRAHLERHLSTLLEARVAA